jgi:predicted alpha/beta hydrolase
VFKSIPTKDGVLLKLEVFGQPNQPTLFINPAIGVKRRLYHDFARWLSEHGTSCVLYNYRGMEDGLSDLPQGVDLSTVAWGQLDQSAVLDWALQALKPARVFLLGHSIGGQLVGFAKQLDQVDGIIHIAAQKGDQQLWSGTGRLKLFMLWHVLIPLMSRGRQFNAARLGLGAYPWPAAAARQWASWGRAKEYLFNRRFGYDLSGWQQYSGPMLSLGFTDDHMAPEAAIDGLLSEFCTAHDLGHIDKRIISPTSLGLSNMGHFGFFKPEAKTLWHDLNTWIKQH